MSKQSGKKKKDKGYKPLSKKFINSVVRGSKKSILRNEKEDINNYSDVYSLAEVYKAKENESEISFFENADISKITIPIFNSEVKVTSTLKSNDTKGLLCCVKNNKNNVIGLVVVYNNEKYFVRVDITFYKVFIHLIHFKFEISALIKYFGISRATIEKKFSAAGYSLIEYEKLICCVPMTILDSKEILKYIEKDLPNVVAKYNNAAELEANEECISLKKAIFCFEYFGITSKLAKKEKKSPKPLTTFVNVAPVIEEGSIPLNSPKEFLKRKKALVDKKERKLKEDVVLQIIESNNAPEKKKVEKEEIKVLEKSNEQENIVSNEVKEEETVKSLDNTYNSVSFDVILSREEEKKKEVGEPYSEYLKVLSLHKVLNSENIPTLVEEVKEKLKSKTLFEVLGEYKDTGALFVYIIYYKEQLFNLSYHSDFYPFEDKVLDSFYKEVGVKVVDILAGVNEQIPIKSDFEYLMRIREKNYKTPYYTNGFDFYEYDKKLLSVIKNESFTKIKKLMFWLDPYDIYGLGKEANLDFVEPKKVKTEIDFSDINIHYYIENALKFKEVINHNDFWTSERHEIFKENFKRIGYNVATMIGCSIDVCQEHSLKYKIYQDYTTKEVDEMKKVYEEGGMDALIKAFPHRTPKALEYKVKEQGWDAVSTIQDKEVFEKELNDKLEEYKVEIKKEVEEENKKNLEKYREEIREEVSKEEAEKVRAKVRAEETQKIEKDFENRLHKSIEQEVINKMFKVELPKMMKNEREKDLKEIEKKLTVFFESQIKDVIKESLSSCSLADIIVQLPIILQDNIKENVLSVIKSL